MLSPACQTQVRFFALRRIKPHTPLLVRAPVNSFEFSLLRAYSPGGELNALAAALEGSIPPTPSSHSLLSGLPGYLILFAPPTFAPERQYRARWPPSPPVFFLISTHFTATPRILPSSLVLKKNSIKCSPRVKLWGFTSDLFSHLRALYAQ